MASENTLGYFSLVAGSDLSTKQYYILKVTGSETVDLAGAGDLPFSVLQNDPVSGDAATLTREGDVTKCVAGAAVAAGASVKPNASGQGIAGTTGDSCIGVALTAATGAGEVIELYQMSHVAL